MKRGRPSVVAALVLAVAGALVLGEPCGAMPRARALGAPMASAADLTRDAALQAKIAAVASAATDEQRTAALAALRSATAPDFTDLVPQLALFLLDADGERAGMTPALIVSQLGISRGQILRALEPHLDTPDAELRAQLENLLGQVERSTAAPSPGLVRYLYARSPAAAVGVLGAATAQGALPSRVAVVEEVRADLAAGRAADADRARAADALVELARDPDWRLRAYAAAVARSQGGLVAAGDRTVEQLGTDAEPRVRAVARGTTTR